MISILWGSPYSPLLQQYPLLSTVSPKINRKVSFDSHSCNHYNQIPGLCISPTMTGPEFFDVILYYTIVYTLWLGLNCIQPAHLLSHAYLTGHYIIKVIAVPITEGFINLTDLTSKPVHHQPHFLNICTVIISIYSADCPVYNMD